MSHSSSTSWPASSDSAGDRGSSQSPAADLPIDPRSMIRDVQRWHKDLQMIVGSVSTLGSILGHILTSPLLVLLRRRLGRRVMPFTLFFPTWLLLGLFAVGSGHPAAIGLVTLTLIAYIVHRVMIWRRHRAGVRHYSYSRGDSWFGLVFGQRPTVTEGILDPLLLIAAAVVFWLTSGMATTPEVLATTGEPQLDPRVFSVYLALAGVALYFIEARLRAKQGDLLMDHIDQQIVSEFFASALSDNTDPLDEGFSIARLAKWTPKQKRMLTASVPDDLGPEWDGLLDSVSPA